MATGRGNATRGNNGRFVRTLKSAERDAEACRMRSRGHSYQEISDALGYGGRAHAHRAVRQALAAVPADAADELRTLMLDQLDYLSLRALTVLETTHYVTTQSGRFINGPDGRPLLDDSPVLTAIDRLIKIQQQRGRLVSGLEPPQRREVITLDAIDAEIAELTAQLGADAADEAEDTAETEGTTAER